MTGKIISPRNALQRLEDVFLGSFFVSFSTGDWWSAHLRSARRTADYYIVFQELGSSKFAPLTSAIQSVDEDLLMGPDSEQVTWAALFASVIRREVVSVSISQDASLKLVFEDEIDMIFRTDADIVDWQRSVETNYDLPYFGSPEIACFWAGELRSSK